MKKNRSIVLIWIFFVIFAFMAIIASFLVQHFHTNIHYKYVDNKIPNPNPEVIQVTEYTEVCSQPQIPALNLDGKTVVMFDISGSMKNYITEMYMQNLDYFKQNTVWCFNEEVKTDFDFNNLEFSGDTDIIKAISYASNHGYKNIILFSDMEDTIGNFDLGYMPNSVNIYIFAPHELEDDAESTIEFLKSSDDISSIKQFVLYGMFE